MSDNDIFNALKTANADDINFKILTYELFAKNQTAMEWLDEMYQRIDMKVIPETETNPLRFAHAEGQREPFRDIKKIIFYCEKLMEEYKHGKSTTRTGREFNHAHRKWD